MTSLKTALGPLKFSNPLCNASGVYSKNQLMNYQRYHQIRVTCITKSCSFEERQGNPKQTCGKMTK